MTMTRRESLALGTATLGFIPIIGAGRAYGAVADEVPAADVEAAGIQAGTGRQPARPAACEIHRPRRSLLALQHQALRRADRRGGARRLRELGGSRPQTAVVANTGAGPDIVIGFSSDPQIYASKIQDMTELADYLGTKYGGWYPLAETYGRKWGTRNWISIPVGGGTGPTVYRQSWVREASYDRIPDDLDSFLDLCQKLQKIGHPSGFSLGHALGDANGFASWLLWTHNAFLVDEKGKIALDSKETQAALKYATELQKTMVAGTLSWNDVGNNKAYGPAKLA